MNCFKASHKQLSVVLDSCDKAPTICDWQRLGASDPVAELSAEHCPGIVSSSQSSWKKDRLSVSAMADGVDNDVEELDLPVQYLGCFSRRVFSCAMSGSWLPFAFGFSIFLSLLTSRLMSDAISIASMLMAFCSSAMPGFVGKRPNLTDSFSMTKASPSKYCEGFEAGNCFTTGRSQAMLRVRSYPKHHFAS
jgi:hypothetical protein